MDTEQLSQAKTKLNQSLQHFKEELGKLRTGRAHPSMLDSLVVEAYGTPMPLKAVGSVTAPEGQLLQITPYDPNNLQAIADAIRKDESLGLTPTDDGHVVRISLPPMTSENRQAMVKILHQKAEEAMISARNARHEGLRKVEEAEKAHDLSRDDLERFKKQVDELLAKHKTDIDELTKAKEQEVLTV